MFLESLIPTDANRESTVYDKPNTICTNNVSNKTIVIIYKMHITSITHISTD